MSHRLPEAKRDHLLNDKGPYLSLVVDKNSTSSETPDGSWDKPYIQIQDALDALPAVGVNDDHDAVGTTIHVMGGVYGTPSFSGEGTFILVSHGVVRLNGLLTYTATGNTNNNNYMVLHGSTEGAFELNNGVTLDDGGGGFDVTCVLTNVITGSDVQTAGGMAGSGFFEFYGCTLNGNVLTNAEVACRNTTFGGTLTADTFSQTQTPISHCRFDGSITLSVATPTDTHFADCFFSTNGLKSFTGPVGSARLDGASEFSFDGNGWSLDGGNTKVTIGGGGGGGGDPSATGRMVVVDASTLPGGDGSWETPYDTIQAALTAKPAHGVDPDVDLYGYRVLILAGAYGESPTFTGEGIVHLLSLGQVVITSLTVNFDGNTDDNNNFYLSGLGGGSGRADHSGMVFTGPVTIDNPTFSFDAQFSAQNVLFQAEIDTFGWEGTLEIAFRHCFVDTLTHSGFGTIEMAAWDTHFGGALDISNIHHARTCEFSAPIRVSGTAELQNCRLKSSYSLDTGVFEVCDYTHYWFQEGGWSLVSGATLEITSHGDAGPHDRTSTAFVSGAYTGTMEDGTYQHPFKTIQTALDSFPAPTPGDHSVFSQFLVIVEGGIYEESLAIPGAGTFILYAQGVVQLGESAWPGLPAGVSRNITRTATTPPVLFWNHLLLTGSSELTWQVSGDIVVDDGDAGHQQGITLVRTTLAGNIVADTTVTGLMTATFRDSLVRGSVSIEGDWIRAYNTSFEGSLTLTNPHGGEGSLSEFVRSDVSGAVSAVEHGTVERCGFNDNVTFTGSISSSTAFLRNCDFGFSFTAVDYQKIFHCKFAGASFTLTGGTLADPESAIIGSDLDGVALTGAAGTLRCDSYTWGTFLSSGGVLAGGLTTPIMANITERLNTLWIPGADFHILGRPPLTHDRSYEDPYGGGGVPALVITSFSSTPLLISPPLVPDFSSGDGAGWAVLSVTIFYRLISGTLAGTRGVDIAVNSYDSSMDQVGASVESTNGFNGTVDLTIAEQKDSANYPATAPPTAYKKLVLTVTTPVFADGANTHRMIEISPDFSTPPSITEFQLLGCRVDFQSRI
tara:strand:+ start:1060 stop:4266 length:3207 start_codon:yes stop_codon:yes gene_type:complete